MLKVGLTGGIAAGKSVVGEMFVALGAHLVQADRIAHSLMQPGEPVYNEVVRHFGREILNPDGSVNRAKLAEAAFGAAGRGEANAPPGSKNSTASCIPRSSAARTSGWMRSELQDPHAVAIVEAALLLEAGAANRFDRLIVVTCNAGAARRTLRGSPEDGSRGRAQGSRFAAWPLNFQMKKRSRPPIT